MLSIMIYSLLLVLLVGLVVRWGLQKCSWQYAVTWNEFAFTAVGLAVLIVPATTYGAWLLAKNSHLTYTEFLNGWETDTDWAKVRCTRDGSCHHTYQCDPYLVAYSCGCSPKGGCSTCFRTQYHHCPYCKEEWIFTVASSLGIFVIGDHRFPDDPDNNRWREGHAVPLSLQRAVGVGIPPQWEAARLRLASNQPGPVTALHDYKNYILASQYTILHQFSDNIESLRKVMPVPEIPVDSFYYANKVYFVGDQPVDKLRWQRNLMYLNAALSKPGADVRLVVVRGLAVDPDAYTNTLKALWQTDSIVGLHALPKNALVVVVGGRDMVEWSRAFTGMPNGNEDLTQALTQIKGPMHPDSLIGVIGSHQETAVIVGGLGQIILKDHPFVRVEMDAYQYLKGEIVPRHSARIWIFLAVVLISSLAWIVPSIVGDRER